MSLKETLQKVLNSLNRKNRGEDWAKPLGGDLAPQQRGGSWRPTVVDPRTERSVAEIERAAKVRKYEPKEPDWKD